VTGGALTALLTSGRRVPDGPRYARLDPNKAGHDLGKAPFQSVRSLLAPAAWRSKEHIEHREQRQAHDPAKYHDSDDVDDVHNFPRPAVLGIRKTN
jgi:hypothetical protein